MNIFKSKKDFIGDYGLQKDIIELLSEVKSIKGSMGDKAYKFDVYLSLFLTAENTDYNYGVATDSNEKATEFRGLCLSAITQIEDTLEHPLLKRIYEVLHNNQFISQYQEEDTRLNLLMALMFDEFIDYASNEYFEKKSTALSSALDIVSFDYLYDEISYIIGEHKLEQFNLILKHKFLLSSFMSTFIQGLTDELMQCIAERDLETNQLIFSICAKNI